MYFFIGICNCFVNILFDFILLSNTNNDERIFHCDFELVIRYICICSMGEKNSSTWQVIDWKYLKSRSFKGSFHREAEGSL